VGEAGCVDPVYALNGARVVAARGVGVGEFDDVAGISGVLRLRVTVLAAPSTVTR